ncbi:MAG TPA: hypothetical protein VIL96_00325 [Gaiellaceae bacterium]|jgi:hypothetical protein
MKFSDKELGNYVSKKLALPGDERTEYREQVNRLLEKLESVLHEDGSYRIQKFRRAGSLEKGTSNRPRAGKPVDADVGVYFAVEDTSSFDVAHLQQLSRSFSPRPIRKRARRTSTTLVRARSGSSSRAPGSRLILLRSCHSTSKRTMASSTHALAIA